MVWQQLSSERFKNDKDQYPINMALYKIIKRILTVMCVVVQLNAYSQFPGLAKTPPMGWNSWNAFDLNINSKKVMDVADSMVSKGMVKAGYRYVVIDDGWQIARDKSGKIIADSSRFPEGIKFLADYIHSRGLKFGIYTCCGTKTCGGRPGSYGYEEIDARTYAAWGVDYIKEDWCFTDGLDTRVQYKKMSDAIRATGRPMLLSLCEWGVSEPWEWAKGVGAMWRSTNDIQDCFDCVRNWGGMGWVAIMEKNASLAPYAGPGHWNDPDMLEVGNKSLNPTECRSHFAMWCMLAAPLIAGNNVATMNDTIKAILTAPEIIAINQDALGMQGTRIKNNDGLQVWQKPLKDGSVAIALLNVTKSDAVISFSLEEIGFKKNMAATVRDLWERKNMTPIKDKFSATVASHGVVVLKVKGIKTNNATVSFIKPSITINQGNHSLVNLSVLPAGVPVTVSSANNDIATVSLSGLNTYKLSANKTGTTLLKATALKGKINQTTTVTVLPSNIPLPWKMSEVKNDKASASFENGVFSIEAAGSDIWTATDQFAFVNKNTTGDAFITAQILAQSNTHPWAKSGLMFRETTAPNSVYVMVLTTPGNGVSLQWRDSTNGASLSKIFPAAALPVYLKLSRSGTMFTAYQSADGLNWNKLMDLNFQRPFASSYLAGMAVSSHDSQLLNLTKFTDVKTGKEN